MKVGDKVWMIYNGVVFEDCTIIEMRDHNVMIVIIPSLGSTYPIVALTKNLFTDLKSLIDACEEWSEIWRWRVEQYTEKLNEQNEQNEQK